MSKTHGSKPTNTLPRKKSRPSKAERRLEARVNDFNNTKGGNKTKFHKPGSQSGRK